MRRRKSLRVDACEHCNKEKPVNWEGLCSSCVDWEHEQGWHGDQPTDGCRKCRQEGRGHMADMETMEQENG